MLGPRDDLPDPLLLQLFAELALPPPSDVLRTIVRQNLAWWTVIGDRRPEHLQHQPARGAGMQTVAHDEPAVVVQEADQIEPPILPLEDEGKQVGLPELVGPSPLEALHLRSVRARGPRFGLIARFVQHPGYGGRTGTQRRSPQQLVAQTLAAPVRMQLLEHYYRALGDLRQLAPRGCTARLLRQPRRAMLGEPLLPEVQRVLGDSHQWREVAGRQATPLPGVQNQQPLMR